MKCPFCEFRCQIKEFEEHAAQKHEKELLFLANNCPTCCWTIGREWRGREASGRCFFYTTASMASWALLHLGEDASRHLLELGLGQN